MKLIKWMTVGIMSLGLIAAGSVVLFLPGEIDRTTNFVIPHDPYVIRPEVQSLHDSLFIADLHTDSLLWKRNLLSESRRGHVDLPRLQRGNVALQVFSATTQSPDGQNYQRNTADTDRITMLAIVSLWPMRTWDSIYERAVYQLEKLKSLVSASKGELVLVTSRESFRQFLDRRDAGDRVIAAIYLTEGAHPLAGDIGNLDRLFEQGLRISGLTHFFDNRLGGSLHGVSQGGLTEFGQNVLRRMDELGLIVDVAHASPQMVSDILDQTRRPVILSHGGMKGVCDRGRNLPDELMKRIADAGGLVGIGYWSGAVCDVSPAGIVANIRYAIDTLGVQHVALGSDYDGATAVRMDTSELAVLTQAMVDAGFSKAEIRAVMGENARRFFLEHLPSNKRGS